MKKSFTNIFLIAFSIISAIGIALACGYGDEYYQSNYTSIFAPEATVVKDYTPLFYDAGSIFYEIRFDEIHSSRFNNDIVQDWNTFLGGKMGKENIKAFLLNDNNFEELEQLNIYLNKNIKNKSYTKWSSIIDLENSKVKDFLDFTYLAKQVDKTATPPKTDYWDYDNTTTKEPISLDIITKLEKKYNITTDQFLKNRYWFQYLKALFYSNEYEEFENFFDKTQNQVPKNDLYYRALSYLAGIKKANKDYSQANLLYARVFDKLPAMRTVATYSFHLKDEALLAQTLKAANTIEDKTALWTILGYYNDEERAINEIYKLNPKSEYLDLMLTRIINKLEEELLPTLFTLNQTNKPTADAKILKMISRIANEKKTSNPLLWQIAHGYTNTLAGDYENAEKIFSNAQGLLKSGKKLETEQLRLLRLVNSINSIKNIKGNNVEQLTEELKWLFNSKKQEKLRSNYAEKETKKYLSELYTKANNQLYGELLNPKEEFFSTNSNVDAVLSFLQKKDKTPFEQLLNNIYPYSTKDLYHYKSLVAVFNDDIDLAIKNMQNSGELNKTILRANPFNGFIKDCNDCQFAKKQSVKYTSLSFLEKMKEMKQKAEQKNDAYNNYLLLANAYYNLTFYGNARIFSNSNLMGNMPYNLNYIKCFAREMLINCSLAKKYYLKAAENAENDEQRAKTAYMISKCERNENYKRISNIGSCGKDGEYYSYIEPKELTFDWKGFKDLKEKYSNTKYYKEVINECGYFKDYINNKY